MVLILQLLCRDVELQQGGDLLTERQREVASVRDALHQLHLRVVFIGARVVANGTVHQRAVVPAEARVTQAAVHAVVVPGCELIRIGAVLEFVASPLLFAHKASSAMVWQRPCPLQGFFTPPPQAMYWQASP
eukprot:CAMPEP_0181345140 /NCGR_PEP_ID=MMETSP1101-20121128/32587_1 /TAXON_ID=46948 /ORGANISM="Rhodomonas abbreviata, Strain Caron Lab Isolate" /LENGTH=131 /DNA_ID=CAMNT_0023457069 /DNA_START=214 /DNA_END=610 /DNA_ORIENTATION=-